TGGGREPSCARADDDGVRARDRTHLCSFSSRWLQRSQNRSTPARNGNIKLTSAIVAMSVGRLSLVSIAPVHHTRFRFCLCEIPFSALQLISIVGRPRPPSGARS